MSTEAIDIEMELPQGVAALLPLVDQLSPDGLLVLEQYVAKKLSTPPAVRQTWKTEIDRRFAEIESGTVTGLTISEFMQQLDDRMKQRRLVG